MTRPKQIPRISNSLHEPDLGALASRRRVPNSATATRRRSQVHGPDAGPMSQVEASNEPGSPLFTVE